MSEGRRYRCPGCGTKIEAWSDGDPYLVDQTGVKRYVYHPDPESLDAVGTDTPHLCLACGARFMVDSRQATFTCPACRSDAICPEFELAGQACPYCNAAHFEECPGVRFLS
jgi:DNA-directed RNA polymerase subunit RPC12/RpoP